MYDKFFLALHERDKQLLDSVPVVIVTPPIGVNAYQFSSFADVSSGKGSRPNIIITFSLEPFRHDLLSTKSEERVAEIVFTKAKEFLDVAAPRYCGILMVAFGARPQSWELNGADISSKRYSEVLRQLHVKVNREVERARATARTWPQIGWSVTVEDFAHYPQTRENLFAADPLILFVEVCNLAPLP